MQDMITAMVVLAGAVALAAPLLYGLTTLYGMKHRKMYPLLRRVDRWGRLACVAVPVGRMEQSVRHSGARPS